MPCDLAAFDIAALHDCQSLEPAEVGEQVRCWLFQGDADRRRIGGRDTRDGAEFVGVGQLLVDDAPIRILDVVGGERATVVEFDAAAQMECPHQLVGAHRPGLGERGTHLEVRVGFDERVEDVLQDLEGKVRVVFWGSSWSGSPAIAATRSPDASSPRSTRSPVEQAVRAATAATTTPTAANTAGLVIAITPEPSPSALYPRGGASETPRRPEPVTLSNEHCDTQRRENHPRTRRSRRPRLRHAGVRRSGPG
jgi:hypothetical protein